MNQRTRASGSYFLKGPLKIICKSLYTYNSYTRWNILKKERHREGGKDKRERERVSEREREREG